MDDSRVHDWNLRRSGGPVLWNGWRSAATQKKKKKKMQIPQHKMHAVQFSFFSGFKSNKEVLFVFFKQVIKCTDKNSMISCDGWISQS